MRDASRMQRRQEAREERKQALSDGYYLKPKKNKCKRQKKAAYFFLMLLFLLLIAAVIMKPLLNKHRNVSKEDEDPFKSLRPVPMFESKEALIEAYRQRSDTYQDQMDEDKTINRAVHISEKELTIIQASSGETKTLISAHMHKGKVMKIAALGRYELGNHNFAMAFKENMLFIIMMALNTDLDRADKILNENGVASEDDLFLKSKNFQIEDKEFLFYITDSNQFYFVAKNKTKGLSKNKEAEKVLN